MTFYPKYCIILCWAIKISTSPISTKKPYICRVFCFGLPTGCPKFCEALPWACFCATVDCLSNDNSCAMRRNNVDKIKTETFSNGMCIVHSIPTRNDIKTTIVVVEEGYRNKPGHKTCADNTFTLLDGCVLINGQLLEQMGDTISVSKNEVVAIEALAPSCYKYTSVVPTPNPS